MKKTKTIPPRFSQRVAASKLNPGNRKYMQATIDKHVPLKNWVAPNKNNNKDNQKSGNESKKKDAEEIELTKFHDQEGNEITQTVPLKRQTKEPKGILQSRKTIVEEEHLPTGQIVTKEKIENIFLSPGEKTKLPTAEKTKNHSFNPTIKKTLQRAAGLQNEDDQAGNADEMVPDDRSEASVFSHLSDISHLTHGSSPWPNSNQDESKFNHGMDGIDQMGSMDGVDGSLPSSPEPNQSPFDVHFQELENLIKEDAFFEKCEEALSNMIGKNTAGFEPYWAYVVEKKEDETEDETVEKKEKKTIIYCKLCKQKLSSFTNKSNYKVGRIKEHLQDKCKPETEALSQQLIKITNLISNKKFETEQKKAKAGNVISSHFLSFFVVFFSD